jgi:hypothetical protein
VTADDVATFVEHVEGVVVRRGSSISITRLLCVRPLSEYNHSGVNGLRDNEILLAAHSALLLNIAELEKRSIFDVLFDMTVEVSFLAAF